MCQSRIIGYLECGHFSGGTYMKTQIVILEIHSKESRTEFGIQSLRVSNGEVH